MKSYLGMEAPAPSDPESASEDSAHTLLPPYAKRGNVAPASNGAIGNGPSVSDLKAAEESPDFEWLPSDDDDDVEVASGLPLEGNSKPMATHIWGGFDRKPPPSPKAEHAEAVHAKLFDLGPETLDWAPPSSKRSYVRANSPVSEPTTPYEWYMQARHQERRPRRGAPELGYTYLVIQNQDRSTDTYDLRIDPAASPEQAQATRAPAGKWRTPGRKRTRLPSASPPPSPPFCALPGRSTGKRVRGAENCDSSDWGPIPGGVWMEEDPPHATESEPEPAAKISKLAARTV